MFLFDQRSILHKFLCMRHRNQTPPKDASPHTGSVRINSLLPSMATAEQIAEILQVSSRTIHLWAAADIIPTALRQGKTVRFHPASVVFALGLSLPEFGTCSESKT